jgi:predicted RNA-binding protein (virulence factor B family)
MDTKVFGVFLDMGIYQEMLVSLHDSREGAEKALKKSQRRYKQHTYIKDLELEKLDI